MTRNHVNTYNDRVTVIKKLRVIKSKLNSKTPNDDIEFI